MDIGQGHIKHNDIVRASIDYASRLFDVDNIMACNIN